MKKANRQCFTFIIPGGFKITLNVRLQILHT